MSPNFHVLARLLNSNYNLAEKLNIFDLFWNFPPPLSNFGGREFWLTVFVIPSFPLPLNLIRAYFPFQLGNNNLFPAFLLFSGLFENSIEAKHCWLLCFFRKLLFLIKFIGFSGGIWWVFPVNSVDFINKFRRFLLDNTRSTDAVFEKHYGGKMMTLYCIWFEHCSLDGTWMCDMCDTYACNFNLWDCFLLVTCIWWFSFEKPQNRQKPLPTARLSWFVLLRIRHFTA